VVVDGGELVIGDGGKGDGACGCAKTGRSCKDNLISLVCVADLVEFAPE